MRALFEAKPYQGADPFLAQFLFIGLDANYDADIERSTIYPNLLDYHRDGPEFWRCNGVHHPFLLPGYRGQGRLYHRNFAKVGFKAIHADLVSFIELLHFPTIGQKQLSARGLSHAHLGLIDRVVLEGAVQRVFIPDRVAALMHDSKCFGWIGPRKLPASGGLAVRNRIGSKVVYANYHFSNYGRFQSRMNQEALEIRKLIPVLPAREVKSPI